MIFFSKRKKDTLSSITSFFINLSWYMQNELLTKWFFWMHFENEANKCNYKFNQKKRMKESRFMIRYFILYYIILSQVFRVKQPWRYQWWKQLRQLMEENWIFWEFNRIQYNKRVADVFFFFEKPVTGVNKKDRLR